MNIFNEEELLICAGMLTQTRGPIYLSMDFSFADDILIIAKLLCVVANRVLC